MTTTSGTEVRRIEPFRLRPWFSPRVWGKTDLRPWYSDTGTTEKVGEAWLTGPECVADTGELAGRRFGEIAKEFAGELGGGEFPLLVKILFPSDKLSVQVHPDDESAQATGGARGKTECWYVLEADADGGVFCGLVDGVQLEDVATAVRGGAVGAMEELLKWVPVSAGDMVFVDAGTVHAIGPGVVLLETQQMSDTTYRLYDYGRPRELHLDAGLRALRIKTRAGKVGSKKMEGFTRLIAEKYFVVDRFDLAEGTTIKMEMDGLGCVVGLRGRGAVNEVAFEAGQAVVVPVGTVTVSSAGGTSFVRCRQP